jgi:glutamyl-tRNA synthetase
MSKVRVRFAPSPTGMLHIGGLRTALYNYLFARHHGGDFLLRIEDTDQTRYVETAEDDIITSLRWAGMDFDEGPGKGGPCAPYRQSERSAIYKQYADQLIENGQAYFAFDTSEEIEDMRQRLIKSGNPSPKYDAITRMSMKNSLTLPKEDVKARLESGEAYVVRLKVPRRETIRFEDQIRGWVSFESQGLDDQVLLKSDGLPTYHLANVVDDHTMDITHVIRGEEWLSSAPKHILLYQYLGWEAPKMAHLPLILSPAGGKLSKRNAEELGIPVNVRQYIQQQYEPQALINFLAFLGWSPGDDREILSMDDMIAAFSLDRVSKGGAVFDFKKLTWYNEQYFRIRPNEALVPEVRANLEKGGFTGASDEKLASMIGLLKDRASRVADISDQAFYFFRDPETYDETMKAKVWKPETNALVAGFAERLESTAAEGWTAAQFKESLAAYTAEKGIGIGKVQAPLRLAVSGVSFGPEVFEILAWVGKDAVIRRLKAAAALIQG